MINHTFKFVALLMLLASPSFAQETFFSYDFEFEGLFEGEGLPLFFLDELNEEGELIGEWSGDDFQLGDPSSFFATANCADECDSSGIVTNPRGGTLLFIDRPHIPASHTMELTEAIGLAGAKFSVTLGTRRTGGGAAAEPKAFDFFGLDSDGNESFRISVLGERQRLGYVADGQLVFDLPTREGEDMAQDIGNTGGPPFGENDDLVELTVSLSDSSYTVTYNNLNGSNSYITESLPFNGTPSDLAQVVLSYGGVVGVTNQQPGFVVDDVSVTGFTNLLVGDLNFDGSVDMSDFTMLAENYGTTSADGDVDFSGSVDLNDWTAFYAAYSAANPAAASVPEPGAGMMFSLALLGLVGIRQRKR